MNLDAIQHAIREAGCDGWLFCDFRHRDLVANRILGLDLANLTSRRWFYWVPAQGEPVKLNHTVEPRKLQSLPGRQEHYLPWPELHAKLRAILGSPKTIAMQYSPLNNIPYVGIVDAGTVDLVRSFGHTVVTSADLVQKFDATWDDAAVASHAWAGERVQRIKNEVFDEMRRALATGKRVDEHGLVRFIAGRFEEEGLTSDDEPPMVGFNDHPADPHFEPTPESSYVLKRGDTILVDLWARRKDPTGIYYDITWCGFAGDKPPVKYVEIFRTAAAARDAAVELVRRRFAEGNPPFGWEVDDAAREVVRKAGYGDFFLHRTGHSIGTAVHGNGVNIDNLETKDERRLAPGVCFSVEPGIYLAGEMAVRSELDVFITPAGKVEVFGEVQKELILLG